MILLDINISAFGWSVITFLFGLIVGLAKFFIIMYSSVKIVQGEVKDIETDIEEIKINVKDNRSNIDILKDSVNHDFNRSYSHLNKTDKETQKRIDLISQSIISLDCETKSLEKRIDKIENHEK